MSELYTIKELTALWKVSDDTIRRRMKEIPDLKVLRLGRLIRISEEESKRLFNRIQRFANSK
jgi:DeoR/GlpR family transcriptional regulator of sugar metabolism